MSVTAAIISGLISLGTATATSVANKRQKNRAQKEARGLYNQQLSDEQKQQSIENSLARKQLSLTDIDLTFKEKMFDEQSKDTEAQIQSDIGKTNKEFQSGATDKLFSNPEESYLFKSRISGRYK